MNRTYINKLKSKRLSYAYKNGVGKVAKSSKGLKLLLSGRFGRYPTCGSLKKIFRKRDRLFQKYFKISKKVNKKVFTDVAFNKTIERKRFSYYSLRGANLFLKGM